MYGAVPPSDASASVPPPRRRRAIPAPLLLAGVLLGGVLLGSVLLAGALQVAELGRTRRVPLCDGDLWARGLRASQGDVDAMQLLGRAHLVLQRYVVQEFNHKLHEVPHCVSLKELA